jgi:hypothetical protein
MIKIEEETKNVTYKKKTVLCDDCGAVIRHDMSCSVARCEICGADLCRDCICHEEPTMGDYREVYCRTCYEITTDNSDNINKLREQADIEEEILHMECKRIRDEKTKAKLSEESKPK